MFRCGFPELQFHLLITSAVADETFSPKLPNTNQQTELKMLVSEKCTQSKTGRSIQQIRILCHNRHQTETSLVECGSIITFSSFSFITVAPNVM